jgi:putative ABC transport system permease protein
MLGVVVGLGGAVALTRLLQGLLFEVDVTDPWVLGGVALLLTLSGAAAALVPAARATRISPVRVLQAE